MRDTATRMRITDASRKRDRGGFRARALILAAGFLLLGLAPASPADRGGEASGPDALIPPDDRPVFSPFLLEETRVQTVISGPVARVVVTQKWTNPNIGPVDGLYIFPLPEDAAVTDMSLRIGERVIRGEMKRREEARALYERAREEGRVAGLLDQERPNIFVQQVANIMPGAAVEVVLSLDHPVACESGSCEYVFPTVVGPRFIPASQTDPGRIDPPVVEEGRRTGQSLHLTVDLDAGVALGEIGSPSHRVELRRRGSHRATAVLARGETHRLDRDFKLRYTLGSDRPEIGVLAWRDAEVTGGPGHFTLLIQPPASPEDIQAAPRELVFVLDCSGSMSGVPMEASKNVVRKALAAVRPGDTFQIIRFSERASGLGPEPLAATPDNIRKALRYIDGLHGSGGTHMIEGIRAALDRPGDPDRLRIVAFLTDGYIGNERQILREVRRLIGSARLFSFGIGSSVNRYLLEGLAEEGRGMAAFLGPREEPGEMVDRFVRRIDMPVLTDIRISWEDLEVQDLEPARVPDLFAGRAVLVHGRYTRPGTGVVVVEGRRGGRWETFRQVAVFHEQETDHEALGRLWARERIHRLERELHDGEDAAVVARITDLGLRHRLMTRWTSLVAVDSVVSNTTGSSRQVGVPVEMPQDVSYEGVFGVQKAAGRLMSSPVSALPARGTGSGVAGLRFSASDAAASRPELAVHAPPPPGGEPSAPSPGGAGGLDEARRPQREMDREGRNKPVSLQYDRVDLFRSDGSRLIVESDGEVWLIDGGRRTLLKTLTTREIRDLASALAAAGAGSWGDTALSGPRLVVRGAWGRASLPLEGAGSAVAAIVEMMEGWAS